ncbi:RNA polymerase [Neosynechococcus sphagnicola sy1]|uniref:RNA polymerase n=1 Tax=Neosynechococcus sphagnicola sy1 TaxID=1497020 RepID=A0A098TQM8_9CYAN|nr:sigma-70 family RNA polymerase sigma factor [Neosynechococcus sphagnicola]KGF73133.1 RNA polymerase [Neosynechococcus sphagnicola sy1]
MTIQPSSNDASLLARIAQHDQTALSELYDRYARVLYAVSFKILGSAEEAEEVVLDVWTQVWRTAGRYDAQRGQVDSWLFLLTRSRALDRLRKLQRSARSLVASQTATQLQSPPLDPVEVAWILERRASVQSALTQLPAEQRQVIELAYYQGLTHAEIATQTGTSLGTVKTRIRLGLSKLRLTLAIPDEMN